MLFCRGAEASQTRGAQAESAGCICRARHRSRATREDSRMSLNRRFHVMRTIPLPSSVIRRGARHPVDRRLPYVAFNFFSCLPGVVREPRRFSFDNSSPSRGAASTLCAVVFWTSRIGDENQRCGMTRWCVMIALSPSAGTSDRGHGQSPHWKKTAHLLCAALLHDGRLFRDLISWLPGNRRVLGPSNTIGSASAIG